MNDGKGLRGLLAAVVIQAIMDQHCPKYRDDAIEFFTSDGFTWLWAVMLEDLIGMPHVAVARQQAMEAHPRVQRRAYHSHQWAC